MNPFWTSLLFVPAGAERHLASAIRHRPDAVILDLEDAIPAPGKPAARAALAAQQAALAEAGIACLLRVNAPLVLMIEDLAAADLPLDGVLLPKVEDPRPIQNAAELTGGVPLIALIETPRGAQALRRLAATPGLAGLMLGSEDYSLSLGIDPEAGGLDPLAAGIAQSAAAQGLMALGLPGSIANFRDLDRYGAHLARARALGMTGAVAIHPAQLPPIRAAFRPTEAERDWASKILAAASDGAGVLAVEGSMVDAPVVERARRILHGTPRG